MIKTPLSPTYAKPNGVLVYDANLPVPDGYSLSSFVTLPAGAFAGNHTHPRQEIFICHQPDVFLHWTDSAGNKHTDAFVSSEGRATMYTIPPHVPHAIVNGSNAPAMLIEYADGPQTNVQPAQVMEVA